MNRSGLIESPYITATRTRFVQPGKIEIDANERAVIGKRNAAFSFAPSSILSLTICEAAAAIEHVIHIRHVRGIEAAQIQICQAAAVIEHVVYRIYF